MTLISAIAMVLALLAATGTGYCFARYRHHTYMARFFQQLAEVSGERNNGYFPPTPGRALEAHEVIGAFNEVVPWAVRR